MIPTWVSAAFALFVLIAVITWVSIILTLTS